MDQNLIQQYVRNQIINGPALLKSYIQDDGGHKYLTRNVFARLKKFVDNFLAGQKEIRLIVMPGLRGTGKTTLIAQIFFELFPDHSEQLLYLSADKITELLGTDLNTVLNVYENILGVSLEKLEHNLFIFIDEIHYDKKWPLVLKSIYDRSKKIFIIATGSSALSLQQANADLARRVVLEKIYPLNFSEYLLLKTKYLSYKKEEQLVKCPAPGLSEKMANALWGAARADDCFNHLKKLGPEVNNYWLTIDDREIQKYLKCGSLPFALEIEDENVAQLLTNELMDKVIERDLPESGKFNSDTIAKIKNVLLMTAASTEISLTKLAANLTDISHSTLVEVFNSLTKAEMLIRVYPFGSAYKKVRKPSKYHFMSPALRHALLTLVEGKNAFDNHKGKHLEDTVAMYFHQEFGDRAGAQIFYDSAKGGADFILLQPLNKKIAVEVGFGPKGIEQAEKTLMTAGGEYGLVICDCAEPTLRQNIIKLPLKYFFLL